MLRTIAKNQKTKGVKSTSIDGNIITCRAKSAHPSLENTLNKCFITETSFDFENIPLEQIYLAAAENLLIVWRREEFNKSSDPESASFEFGTEWVMDQLPQVKLSYKERVTKEVARTFTKEELLQMAADMD